MISLCDLWKLYWLFLNSLSLPVLSLLTYFTSLSPCPFAIHNNRLGIPQMRSPRQWTQFDMVLFLPLASEPGPSAVIPIGSYTLSHLWPVSEWVASNQDSGAHFKTFHPMLLHSSMITDSEDRYLQNPWILYSCINT